MKHAFFVGIALALAASVMAPVAGAEEPAAGLMKDKSASTGREDVATSGFEAASDKKAAAEAKDVTELKLSAGGLASGGNSRSLSATGSEKFRARRRQNQLSLAASANYGRSAPTPADSMQTSVENYQGRARYDRFLNEHFALFGAMSALRDRFQGLDLRLNFDPGIAIYFVNDIKQQLWSEFGYDLQYDVRRDATLRAARAMGNVLEKTEVRHSGRAFLGYNNTLTQAVTLDTGLEYLQALSEPKNWRLNWNIAITSNIGGNFSVASAFSLKYDNNPLPGIKKTDYLSSLSLVYQLL